MLMSTRNLNLRCVHIGVYLVQVLLPQLDSHAHTSFHINLQYIVIEHLDSIIYRVCTSDNLVSIDYQNCCNTEYRQFIVSILCQNICAQMMRLLMPCPDGST
jgi:hypothetical protein